MAGYQTSYAHGEILKQRHRFEEAIAAFYEALGHRPNDPWALAEIAICQSHIPGGELMACDTMNEAISNDPQCAYFHGQKAWLLCRAGRPVEAGNFAQSCIDLEPGDPLGHTMMAMVECDKEAWVSAEHHAREALALNSDSPGPPNFLCQALYEQGKITEAAEIATSQLARSPENAYAHYNAGFTALAQGEQESAEGHFFESLRIDPQFEHARFGMLEAVRARSGLYRKFLKIYFKLRSKNSWVFAPITNLTGTSIQAVATLLMYRDPLFRAALDTNDKLMAILGGGCLLLAVPIGILALVLGSPLFAKVVAVCLALGLYIAATFSDELPDRLKM